MIPLIGRSQLHPPLHADGLYPDLGFLHKPRHLHISLGDYRHLGMLMAEEALVASPWVDSETSLSRKGQRINGSRGSACGLMCSLRLRTC